MEAFPAVNRCAGTGHALQLGHLCILGLAVICDEKEYGIIKDIYDTKGSKLILISYNDKDIFIPFVEEFIKQVDVNNKRVIVERIREFL